MTDIDGENIFLMNQEIKMFCTIGIHEKIVSPFHEGAFYQLFVWLSSATSFEPIFGNIDVSLGIY